MNIEQIIIKLPEIDEAISLLRLKRIIAGYCSELAEEADTSEIKRYYERKAEALNMCHASWISNHYEKIYLKDFQYVLHCHDKFCPVCQKLVARSREMKYKPVLEKFAEDYDIYHLTLTSSNEPGVALRGGIGRYQKSMQKLIGYLSGHKKIAGIDFTKYGYVGALRALEIVPNIDHSHSHKLPNGTELFFKGVHADYHVHYHVMLALKKNLNLEHYITNTFSKSYKEEGLYHFSELEVLIQDIWYLLMNGQKVTKAAIDALQLGYSCKCKLIMDGGYHQVFKYVTKTQDYGAAIPLEVFKTLDSATKNKRVIQGFGIFYGLGLEKEEITEEFDPAYDNFIMLINSLFEYVQVSETPYEIRGNIKGQKSLYLSRKKYRELSQDTGDTSEFNLPDYLKPLPPKLAKHLINTAEQLSIDLPAAIAAVGNLSYLDGGRSVKPKKGE